MIDNKWYRNNVEHMKQIVTTMKITLNNNHVKVITLTVYRTGGATLFPSPTRETRS